MGLNQGDIAALMKGLAPVVRDYLQESVQPVVERLHEIEKQQSRAIVRKEGKPGGFDGEAFGLEICEIVKGYVDRQIAPLKEEIAGLRAENKKLADRGMIYRGVWQPAEEYKRGDVVTADGSMWVAVTAAGEPGKKPGTGTGWQLAVKQGRDAKP